MNDIIIIIIINECQCGANRLLRRLQGRCHAIVAIITLKISDVRRQTIDGTVPSSAPFWTEEEDDMDYHKKCIGSKLMVIKFRRVLSLFNLSTCLNWSSKYLHDKILDFVQQTFGWLRMKTDDVSLDRQCMKANINN